MLQIKKNDVDIIWYYIELNFPKTGCNLFNVILILITGCSCEVQIEVYVEKSSVASLNNSTDQIDDILVLHLHEGKDFFISSHILNFF